MFTCSRYNGAAFAKFQMLDLGMYIQIWNIHVPTIFLLIYIYLQIEGCDILKKEKKIL